MGSCPDADIDLLFVYGKIFARGKIKSERKSYVKKLIKEIKKAQRRKKEYHSVKKGKHSFVFLCGSDRYDTVPRWRPDF